MKDNFNHLPKIATKWSFGHFGHLNNNDKEFYFWNSKESSNDVVREEKK